VILCSLTKIKLTDTIGPLIPYISILIADLVIMAFLAVARHVPAHVL